MDDAREDFLRSTFTLAKSSPMAWHNFVAALDKYAISEVERGLAATTADTFIAVGMGRRLIELRNEFRDIESVGRKLNLVA
jgi:hypothetical protein